MESMQHQLLQAQKTASFSSRMANMGMANCGTTQTILSQNSSCREWVTNTNGQERERGLGLLVSPCPWVQGRAVPPHVVRGGGPRRTCRGLGVYMGWGTWVPFIQKDKLSNMRTAYSARHLSKCSCDENLGGTCMSCL